MKDIQDMKVERYIIFIDEKTHWKTRVSLKEVHRFHKIPIKISIAYFKELDKLTIKFIRRE